LKPLMEYVPGSPYWETVAESTALSYWMRQPYVSDSAQEAQKLKWYMKGPRGKLHGVPSDSRNHHCEMGVSAQYRDIRFAPTGVSVILASYEPHNKRQEMSILMHPVLDKSGTNVKFLSTFRQEIGPCVGKGDDIAMLYPPAAIYGTNMDYLIIAQILAVRRHAYNNGPMPYFVVEDSIVT
jgi:hypothetical protein